MGLVLTSAGLTAGLVLSPLNVADGASLPVEDKLATKPNVRVRKLVIKPVQKNRVALELFAERPWSPGVKTYASLDGVPNLLGEFARQVDFDREQLVRICWQTGGPPFGTLEYRIREGDLDLSRVVFYVKEADLPNLSYRGLCCQTSLEFFAVTALIRVDFEGEQAEKVKPDALR